MTISRTSHGFTLIEMLVVVLILGILMAIAMPLYLSAVADSQVKTCRANMQTIGNVEQEYRLKDANHNYTTTLSNLSADLPVVPKCPMNGTYTVTISNGSATAQNGQTVPNGGLIISCSVSGHGKFAPGVDSQ